MRWALGPTWHLQQPAALGQDLQASERTPHLPTPPQHICRSGCIGPAQLPRMSHGECPTPPLSNLVCPWILQPWLDMGAMDANLVRACTNAHHAHGHVAHLMLSRPQDVRLPTLASPDCHSCFTPAAKRPGSAAKRASSSGVGGRSGSAGDPTNIGTLRDSVRDDSSLMRSCWPALLTQHASLAHAHTHIPHGPHEHTVKQVHSLSAIARLVAHPAYPVNAPCSKVMHNSLDAPSGGCAVQVSWGTEAEEERRRAADTPKARGLVKDTVDPRLRKSVAR